MRVVIGGTLRLTAKAYRDQFARCFELYEKYSPLGDNPTYTADGVKGATISLLETQGAFLRALGSSLPQGWYADEDDRCAVVNRVKKQNLTGAQMFDNGLLDAAGGGINNLTADMAVSPVDDTVACAMCQLVEALYAAGDWWYYNSVPISHMDTRPDPLPHIRKLIATNDTRLAALKNTAFVAAPGTAHTKGTKTAGLAAVLSGNVPAAVIDYIRKEYKGVKGKRVAFLMLALKSEGYFTSSNKTDFYRAFLRDTGSPDRVESFRKGVDKYVNASAVVAGSEWVANLTRVTDIAPIVANLRGMK